MAEAELEAEAKQLKEDLDGASGLKEDDAWPAQPQAKATGAGRSRRAAPPKATQARPGIDNGM